MGKTLKVQLKESSHNREGCIEYKNKIQLEDFRQLGLLFLDLESHGGKIEKAFFEFKRKKEEGFPW